MKYKLKFSLHDIFASFISLGVVFIFIVISIISIPKSNSEDYAVIRYNNKIVKKMPLSIDDDIDFFNNINVYVLAEGVVSEYLFLKGDFEESYVWDDKFKNSLKSILRVKRRIVTPAKGWL